MISLQQLTRLIRLVCPWIYLSQIWDNIFKHKRSVNKVTTKVLPVVLKFQYPWFCSHWDSNLSIWDLCEVDWDHSIFGYHLTRAAIKANKIENINYYTRKFWEQKLLLLTCRFACDQLICTESAGVWENDIDMHN